VVVRTWSSNNTGGEGGREERRREEGRKEGMRWRGKREKDIMCQGGDKNGAIKTS
jgi:hypothetical protein